MPYELNDFIFFHVHKQIQYHSTEFSLNSNELLRQSLQSKISLKKKKTFLTRRTSLLYNRNIESDETSVISDK